MQECRNEARSNDMDIKCAAILKLIYLEMFGHSMSWASFHVLEVMSSQKFVQKRVGDELVEKGSLVAKPVRVIFGY
ncbi:AP-3 complex subunit delta [Orbilia oligospora]|uniref:AP-3 complex subunit delta n=1 Tax=Orbilia oligospora TaxID=2813651 RepID=A0A7C8K6I2_ORBOL|nr:AP-3 complex subunit delta [Orbilia oligospora]